MADAGLLCRIGRRNALARLRLDACLIAVAHEKHRLDTLCHLNDGGLVIEIAGDDFDACVGKPPGGITVRPAGQRLDVMAARGESARDAAALLAGCACYENGSADAHLNTPFRWGRC